MTEPMPRGRTRRIAIAGARGVLGLVGVGVAAACVAAATWLPLPVIGTPPSSTIVKPVASAQQRICAGPILRLGSETGQEATTAVSLGAARVTLAATHGSPRLENMDYAENESNTPSQRLVLDPPADGESASLVAGSQSQAVDDNDFVGFAASACAKSSSDTWLVGGSTVTGRTTLISLNNPSKVSSTVNVNIYSETGPADTAGTTGIIVPPGGQRVLSLAGFAPGIARPVVHVTSNGGQVTASLQESIVRTLAPGGVDVFGATTRPSTLNVVPGVVLANHDAVVAASALNGHDDVAGVVRVFVPGGGPADVTIAATQEDGSSAPTTSTLTVEGDKVTDIPLGDFPDGTWTFTITTERPAVAAVRTSTVTLEGDAEQDLATGDEPVVTATDFGWFAAAPELAEKALVSVAEGPSPMLHLVNTATTTAQVTINAREGADTSVTVPAGRALAVPVVGGISYNLSGFASLRVAVSYQGEGQLAGFVLSPPERASLPVTVYHQFG